MHSENRALGVVRPVAGRFRDNPPDGLAVNESDPIGEVRAAGLVSDAERAGWKLSRLDVVHHHAVVVTRCGNEQHLPV